LNAVKEACIEQNLKLLHKIL